MVSAMVMSMFPPLPSAGQLEVLQKSLLNAENLIVELKGGLYRGLQVG
jgi:hypothetical protein